MDELKTGFNWLAEQFNSDDWNELNRTMTFNDYLGAVEANPLLARSAYQRLYDMIIAPGSEKIKRNRRTYTHYNFFDDPQIPIFGLEKTIDELVKFIRGAAGFYGAEKRVLLLHGPVGSAKSTICRLLKRGMEAYSRKNEGAWYTYKWINLPVGGDNGIYTHKEDECPMHDDPLKLIPLNIRTKYMARLNEILRDKTPEESRNTLYPLRCEGELNPRCKKFMQSLLNMYDGDWQKVVENHIVVVRKVYNEADRIGIATFQPKDEKNQDATELTGDINYAKLNHFGADSDPRAFNFDGEFCVGNRGICEFIEMLKLEKAFLYDLLGASQERSIKPKKFSQISVDEVLIGHTNNPEYEKLKNDLTMEALRDRTVKIDVPYLLRMSDELKVLRQDYGPEKVRQHVAPHTLEITAFFLILTRIKEEAGIPSADEVMLYDGKMLPGYTEDRVKEMQDKSPEEGMKGGVSVRFAQDKISNCLSSRHDYINPFMVLNEIREGLTNSSLIVNKDEVEKYINCVDLSMKELDHILKKEVQKALVGDEETIIRLCANYIDNVVAYIHNTKVINPYTGKEQSPDEKLMRSIEEKIDIPDIGSPDFRRGIAAFIGTMQVKGEKFTWESNAELRKALEAKLFEDTKDHIKLSALHQSGASVVDPDLQEKIDAIKQRLIKQNGYNEQSATDVLNYVGSIFARGDVAED